MPSVSQPMADFLYNISNIVLAGGATAVLLGTIGAIWMGGIKEQYGDDRIKANETETARANESAAQANERSARLEKEAADARVEQGRLALALRQAQNEIARTQQGVARHVSEQQADALRTELNGQNIHIRLLYEGSQPEAANFARELGSALQRAGVLIDEEGPNMVPGNTGLEVYGSDNNAISTKIAEMFFTGIRSTSKL